MDKQLLKELLEAVEDGSIFDNATVRVISMEGDKVNSTEDIKLSDIMKTAYKLTKAYEDDDVEKGVKTINDAMEKYGMVKGAWVVYHAEKAIKLTAFGAKEVTPTAAFRKYIQDR